MMKKLLQINTVVNTTSTGRIAEDIGNIAMQNGWESHIAFGRNEQKSNSTKIKIGNRYDFIWHGLATRLFDKHGFASKNATKDLVRQIYNLQPDIIHLHNLHGYYLNIEVLFSFLAHMNIPVVWTLHDCWPFTGHCTHFSFINCNKWRTHCSHCPQKKEYPASFFKDNSYNNFERKRQLFTLPKNMTLIPASYWLEEILKESFFKGYPMEVIHNGIDTDVFKPTKYDYIINKLNLRNHFIILGVANIWINRKGIDDFIKLSEELSENDRIILVGLNKKQIKNLPANIIGLERTESIAELAALYSGANLFVNPTWEDNFPTTNLEAMACGTPVVTYKTGGSPESITPETGFIIEQGDIKGLIQTIHSIKERGKEYYQEACRRRAVEHYNKKDKFKDYITLYNRILNWQ